jgi:hypothetical protein
VIGSDLYVCGSIGPIAKWDGTNWSSLGGVFNNEPQCLAVSGTDLYVGGSFTTAGGDSANRIAKWSASGGWSALGSGTNGNVLSIVVNGTDLYAGGFFTTAGGDSAYYIAKWDGTNWSPLGSGTNDAVFTFALDGNNLYVGGQFTTAGGKPSGYIALWHIPGTVGVEEISSHIPEGYTLYQNYPNPFNPLTTIRFSLPVSGLVKITIYDVQGQEIETLVNKELAAGEFEVNWNAGNFSSGVYFYRLQSYPFTGRRDEGFTETKKFILLK